MLQAEPGKSRAVTEVLSVVPRDRVFATIAREPVYRDVPVCESRPAIWYPPAP